MEIYAAGVGSAFEVDPLYCQTYVVKEESGDLSVIDMGDMAHPAITRCGFKMQDIKRVFISHAHVDHIGHIARFGLMRYDWLNKPDHYSKFVGTPAPELVMHKSIYEDVWATVRSGLSSIEAVSNATLETFFKVTLIEDCNSAYVLPNGFTVNFVHQMHALNGFNELPCFGLVFQKQGHKSFYFTADSQHCSPAQMEVFYQKYDIIIQDCEVGGSNFKFKEGQQVYKDENGAYNEYPLNDTVKSMELCSAGIFPEPWQVYKFHSRVHAHCTELAGYSNTSKKLKNEIRNKMWLSHYSRLVIDNKDSFGNEHNWEEWAKENGFAGFAQVGQRWEI